MNKLILGLILGLYSFSVIAGSDEVVKPSAWGTSKYVAEGRFIVTSLANPLDKVITDTKSGCQYLLTYGNGISQIPLGCFEEYKKK